LEGVGSTYMQILHLARFLKQGLDLGQASKKGLGS
jgi:hypothetical protein